MNKFAAAIAVSLSAVVFSPAVVSAGPLPEDTQYLFTLAASSGTFDGNTLTLDGVPVVVYFADRPKRITGQIDLPTFLALWDGGIDSFKDNPPNAELAIYRDSGDIHPVLIISAPTLNGDDVSFKVSMIDGSIPESFTHSTLFIDAFPCPVNGCPSP